MSAEHQLDATWAISSKKPGQNQGYEITCAPANRTTAAWLRTLAENMGTPTDLRAGYRDALPWLAFTGGGHAHQAMIALTFIDWSDERDGTRQPITPARAIWLPWEAVVSVRLDYLSLWRGVAGLRWPEVDGGPEGTTSHSTVIVAPQRDPQQVVNTIRRLGFEFVTRIAAHLVDGCRVAIVLGNGDPITTAERLTVLDAVLAVLPFGARNCLTVATWASYKATHDVALAFSDGVQPDQAGVVWHGNRQLAAPQERGRAYLQELERIIQDGHDVTRIVDHLVTRTEPLRRITEFDLDTLRDIRFASAVYDKVLQHAASVDEVGRALRDPAVTEIQASRFAQFLAIAVCSSDRKEAKKAKETIVAQWRPSFAAVLGELCRNGQQLVAEQVQTWLDLCQEADKNHAGATSAYLAAALRPPVVPLVDREAMAILANLTLHYLVAAKTVDAMTYQRLVEQPHVLVRALSGMLLERPNKKLQRIRNLFRANIKGILSVLTEYSESQGPAWLRPILLAAQAQPDRIEPMDVEILAKLGHRAMSFFVDLLAHRAGLFRSLDISWPAVVQLLHADFANAYGIVRTLLSASAGKHEQPSPAHQARIAVLSLLCDVPHSFDLVESASDNEWLDAFQHTLRAFGQDLRTQVGGKLVALLHDRFSSLPPEVVQRLDIALGTNLTERYLDMLAQRLAAGQVREVMALDLPQTMRQRLRNRPDLAWFRSLLDLAALVEANASVSDVFNQATGAVRKSVAANEVVHFLCEYADKVDAVAMEQLLAQLLRYDENGTFVALRVRDHLLSANTASAQRFITHVNEKLNWYTLLSRSGAEPEGFR